MTSRVSWVYPLSVLRFTEPSEQQVLGLLCLDAKEFARWILCGAKAV
jgi:hypothetical protein